GLLIAPKEPPAYVEIAVASPFGNEVALALVSALHEQLQPWRDHRPVVARQGHLLTNDRREIAVEGQQELLELPALFDALQRHREALKVPGVAGEQRVGRPLHEDAGPVETKERVDRAVMEKPEAPDLLPHKGVVHGGIERVGQEARVPWHPEHA